MEVLIVEKDNNRSKQLQNYLKSLTTVSKTIVVDNAIAGINALKNYQPDAIFFDFSQCSQDLIDAIAIQSEDSDTTLVNWYRNISRQELLTSLERNVKHFLNQQYDLKSLYALIEAIAISKNFIDESAWNLIQTSILNTNNYKPLTPKEQKVLELLADSMTYQEIANILKIQKTTVRTHINSLYNKLRVRNRQKLIATASSLELI